MWLKTCLAICVALTFFATSPARALLVPGSYILDLIGETEDDFPVVGEGRFDIDPAGNIENFTMDLLFDGVPANADSRYVNDSLMNVAGGPEMLLGIVESEFGDGIISFDVDGEWDCESSSCSSSGGLLDDPSGIYSVSKIPLPAAIWLFVTALLGLRLFGWRRRNRAAA